MKAMVILDEMPVNCLSCPFTLSHICEVEKITVGEILDGKITRHESCPLRPLPQKKEIELPWLYAEYENGWNDCLDEITGEKDESRMDE